MNNSILNTLVLGFAFLLLFFAAELLYRRCKLKVEISRKIVHFGSGLLSLSFPVFIDNLWLVLVLCLAFIGLLALSFKYNFLKSINSVDRKTHGSLLFPIVVFVCYLAYLWSDTLLFYYLPLLILSISDPMAALVGKRFPIGKYQFFGSRKTLMGSAAFFATAFLTSLICINLFLGIPLLLSAQYSLFLALGTTAVEAVLAKGYDNFFIPLSSMAILIIIELYPINF